MIINNVPTSLSQLGESHILDLDDLDYDGDGCMDDNEEQEREREGYWSQSEGGPWSGGDTIKHEEIKENEL